MRDYFNPDKDPSGYLLPSVVTMKGVWARLSNIDDDHKWVADESFWVGDRHIERKAGKSPGRTMYEIVEIRKRRPELFEDLVVMQQPSAFTDEIIEVWIIEDLASRCTQAIHQRDLFGAAMTNNSLKAMQIAQMIPCWIAPKMTPVLQLTDTDIAFILKRFVDREKEEIARDFRAVARLAGERCVYNNLNHEDTLRLIQNACRDLEFDAKKTDVVLCGLRRNGMLAYRPDFKRNENGTVDYSEGKFIKAHEQDWAKEKPMGSHRMLDEWHEDRFEFLDAETRRPKPADWTQISGATKEADLAELDYCSKEKKHQEDHTIVMGGKIIKIPVIDIFADKQCMIPEDEMNDFLNPKQRRLKEQAARSNKHKLPEDKKSAYRHLRYLERLKMKECLRAADASWREHLNAALTKATRYEILSKLQPGVKGKKGANKNVKKDTLKSAKMKIYKAMQKKKIQKKPPGKEDEEKEKEAPGKDSGLTLTDVILHALHNYPSIQFF